MCVRECGLSENSLRANAANPLVAEEVKGLYLRPPKEIIPYIDHQDIYENDRLDRVTFFSPV